MLTRHVFIIGMPGSGKSSLGRRVANNLQLPWFDTDTRIAEETGCTIPELFQKYGEQAFRNAETNLLMKISAEPPSIVSTGGGMVVREENRRILKNFGYIVLIDRPLADIRSDIKLDRRPILAAKGLDEVDRMYSERMPIYRAAADRVLDNSHGYIPGMRGLEQILRELFPGMIP